MSLKLYGRFGLIAVSVLIALAALTTSVRAQNLPPPGAYQPIPNFTGVGAGLLFRKAINDRFSGVQPIAPSLISIAFADMGDEQDAMELYCNDCQATTPCTGGGPGAWAFGERGVWNCVAGSFVQTTGGDLSGPFSNATVNTVEGGQIPVTAGYTGALSLTGNSGNGSDQISGANVNGTINPRAYGAVGLKTASTCATSINSNLVTITPRGDFQNGQTVMCAHAGLPSTATAPSAFTVVASDPSGVGASSWTYNICTFDAVTGQMSGCASAAVNNTAGLNSNLSGNSNLLHWTRGVNGTATAIYNQTGLIGLIPIGVTSFRDVGQAIEAFNELPATPPSGALNQRLSTTITGGGGTTSLVLGSAANAAISGQFFSHDDTAAIQAAFADAQNKHTSLRFPTGNYNYFGAGLGGSTATFISVQGEPPLMTVVGDAASQSAVYLAAGGYFIDDSAAVVQLQLRDMTFVGGHGAVRMTSTAVLGHGERKIYNNAFLGFTGCAVCWNAADDPYHRVEGNRFRGLDVNATIGFGFTGANDSSNIVDNAFNTVRIGIEDAGEGVGRNYSNNDFIRTNVAPFSRADIWLADSQQGIATMSRMRLANEGIDAGDYHVLVADADASGSMVGDRFPVAPHANYGTGEIILDGAITTGLAVLTSGSDPTKNTAHFSSSAHVNDWVRVLGAGTQGSCVCELVAQINSIDSDRQVTLNASASATVAGAIVVFGTASTKPRVGQITMSGNWVSAASTNPPIPWVFTTAQTTSGWLVVNNTISSPSLSGPIMQYLPLTQTAANANLNLIFGTNGLPLGSGSDPSQGMYPSNNPDAVVAVDPLTQLSTWSQPPPYQATIDNAGVIDYLPSTPIASFANGPGVSKTAISDRGGASDATEANFSLNTTNGLLRADFTPSTRGLAWITFDFKKASSTPLAHFMVTVAYSANPGAGGSTLIGRQIDIPETSGWYTLSLPFVPKDTTTALTASFQAVGVAPAVEIGSIDIGRVHVYQHETPVDLSNVAIKTLQTNVGDEKRVNTVTYSASMTPDLSKGPIQSITITNGSAMTINNPINPPSQAGYNTDWALYIKNSSGSAAGAITLGSAFQPTGAGAVVAPANGLTAVYRFQYDGTTHTLLSAIANGGVVTMAGDVTGQSNTNTVTTTHLAAALPISQGGTGTASTLTGLVRGNASAMTAAELSGDASTSGSNAVTVTKVNNNTPGNTCTNQFTRSIDSSARGTCATITNADLTALASPPAIGNTTPAAGSFTTLKLSTFTVAGLPTCNAGADAIYVTVTDATAVSCVGGSVFVGGSTNYCLAICKNGIGWVNP